MDYNMFRRFLTRTVLVLAIAAPVASAEAQQSSAAVSPAAIKALTDMACVSPQPESLSGGVDDHDGRGAGRRAAHSVHWPRSTSSSRCPTSFWPPPLAIGTSAASSTTARPSRCLLSAPATTPRCLAPPTLRELDDAPEREVRHRAAARRSLPLRFSRTGKAPTSRRPRTSVRARSAASPASTMPSGRTMSTGRSGFRRANTRSRASSLSRRRPKPRDRSTRRRIHGIWRRRINEESFTFVPPAGARKIVLAAVGEPQGGK